MDARPSMELVWHLSSHQQKICPFCKDVLTLNKYNSKAGRPFARVQISCNLLDLLTILAFLPEIPRRRHEWASCNAIRHHRLGGGLPHPIFQFPPLAAYSWSTLSRHIYLSQNKWVNWVRTQESGRDQPLSQLVIISCDLSEQSRPRMHLVTMDSRTYHTMWREGNFTADIARSLRQMTHDGGAIERFNAGQCCTSPEERN